MSNLLSTYEARMSDARTRFARGAWVTDLIEGAPSVDETERFLLWFSALGCQMTRPVDGWIRRAGERCLDLGVDKVGRALITHAKHEAGHDAMYADDTRALAARRAARGWGPVDADRLLATPATPGVQRYVDLHEENIASDTPYGQLAIEYEIENLSTAFGPGFVAKCTEVLGADITDCMSFVTEHTVLDVGHTEFNRRQIARFLEERPDALDALVRAGTQALDAFSAHLDDCVALAQSRAPLA